MPPLGYRRDIDGLRAVAVVPVLLFHGGFTIFGGGYVGVDIFFVISGFLITSLLVKELEQGQFSLANFYERRIRRIFPALFVMFGLTTALALLLLMPRDLVGYGKSLASAATSVSNIYFWSDSGYFDSTAASKPLLHTWSLAVEEQFYIFFPLVLWGLYKYLGRRWLLPACGAGLIASLGLSIWGLQHTPEATFYLLPTRAWELLVGAVLALGLPGPRSRTGNEVLAIMGIMAIAGSIFGYTEKTPFPGLAALLPCLGAGAVLLAGQHQQTWVSKCLSLRPTVFVGRISYSLYLWHWPLLVLGGYYAIRKLTSVESIGLLLLAAGLATASWWLVERPFRGAGARSTRRQIFVMGGMLVGAAVGLGGIIVWSRGWPTRLEPATQTMLEQYSYRNDQTQQHSTYQECHLAFEKRLTRLCLLGDTTQSATFLLVGDSHANASAGAVAIAARQVHRAGLQLTDSGYTPTLGYLKWGEREKFQYMHDYVQKILAATPTIRTVFIISYWQQALYDNTYVDETGRKVNGLIAGSQGYARLARAYPQITFWLVEDNPAATTFGANALARKIQYGRTLDLTLPRAAAEHYRARYMPLLGGLTAIQNVRVVPLLDLLCNTEVCPAQNGPVPYYRDDNHFSTPGALRTIPAYLNVLHAP